MLATTGCTRCRLLLPAREHQQMVVSRALVRIDKDFVGADDLPEFQRRVRIARSEVGMSALDGSAKRGPEILSVIARKSAKQIVKRVHRRSRCRILVSARNSS